MADPKDVDVTMEDDYDEEADSDFDARNDNTSSTSGEETDSGVATNVGRPTKRRKIVKAIPSQPGLGELDSGDEATIRERLKTKRKGKKKDDAVNVEDSDIEGGGWRARTRAMRDRDRDEKKRGKLANVKGSTLDVDKIWEDMNKTGGTSLFVSADAHAVQPTRVQDPVVQTMPSSRAPKETLSAAAAASTQAEQHGDVRSKGEVEEMVTIKRTYKFAGEVHTEERAVPKSSAEARLWLLQQSSKEVQADSPGARPLRRPLRKISRFDPNLNNLDSFKKNWEKYEAFAEVRTGPKLNTVEKSKMDWAAHVDQEGLKDELDEHAKAKEGYLSRMDFLGEVEQRREEEARQARLRV